MSTSAPSFQQATSEISLEIGGMTCASCVGRVQKALNRVEGVVEVSVNLATETAQVVHDDTVGTDDLTAAVAKAGYTATVRGSRPQEHRTPDLEPTDDPDRARDAELGRLEHRWQVALTTGLALMGDFPTGTL